MTKVIGPALSLEARGKFGNTVQFQKTPEGYSLYKKHKPGDIVKKEASSEQINMRTIYNLIIARWQSLSDEEKNEYRDEVKSRGLQMSGWNLFYKYAQKDLKKYLEVQGLWLMNEIEGGYILDKSGNENNGELLPNYPTNAPELKESFKKKVGTSLYFNGDSQLVNCGVGQSLNPKEKNFTISFFLKLEGEVDETYLILRKKFGGTPYIGYAIYYHSDSQSIKVQLRGVGDGGTSTFGTDTKGFVNGKWFHFACVVNVAESKLKIYIRGIEESTIHDISGIGEIDSESIFYLSYTSYFLVGKFDIVQFHNRALEEGEIMNIANI